MTIKPKYNNLLLNGNIKRWYENLSAKSILTASVYLRTLGYYCIFNNTNPDEILKNARLEEKEFRYNFIHLVKNLEKEGKACSYIVRSKNGIL